MRGTIETAQNSDPWRPSALGTLFLLMLLFLTACGETTSTPPAASLNTPVSSPASQTVTPGSGALSAGLVDWADVMRFNGITYSANYDNPSDTLEADKEFSRVKFMLADQAGADHQLQDGDAAFLPVGTPVYSVKGYRPQFRLMAKDGQGAWRLYEASGNPAAKTGADLLDISGKVAYISINSKEDERVEITAIKEPTKVARLVELVLQAPYQERLLGANSQLRYFVVFHLQDGSQVRRSLGTAPNVLWPGLAVSDEFVSGIEGAVKSLSPAQIAALTPTPKVQPGTTINLARAYNLAAAYEVRLKLPPPNDRIFTDPAKIKAIVASLDRSLVVQANPAELPLPTLEGNLAVIQFEFKSDQIVQALDYDRQTGLLYVYANQPQDRVTVKAPPELAKVLGWLN